MSDEIQALERTLNAVLADEAQKSTPQDSGDLDEELWARLVDLGFTDLSSGESEAALPVALAVARCVGRSAVFAPLIETSGLASWMLNASGMDMPDGVVTASGAHPDDKLVIARHGTQTTVTGTLHRVPWGGRANSTIALVETDAGPAVVALPKPKAVHPGRNLALEPRDRLSYEDTPLDPQSVSPTPLNASEVFYRGALLRAAAASGAAAHVLELAVDHAATRKQFGRPIANFQAVQHHLALMAQQVAALDVAVRAAAYEADSPTLLTVATAKTVAHEAAGIVARRAHQVIGAIGVTQEHPLRLFSTRLWSWQDEYGSARYWSKLVGEEAPEDVWAYITRQPTHHAV